MKQVIIAILAVVAIIGGAVVFGKDKSVQGETTNHLYGKNDSTIKIIEYGDFECPACLNFYPIVEEVKEKYKDKIAFQFKHFPLVQSHQNALAAHRAAEAASKQGKFWEMYNILYQNQETWNGPSGSDPVGIPTGEAIGVFEQYAKQIGLNVEQYKTDVNDSSTVGAINADIARGKADYEVSGTPSFIINGKKVDDLSTINTVEKFSQLIDEAIGAEAAKSDSGQSTSTEQKPEEESTQQPATPTTDQ